MLASVKVIKLISENCKRRQNDLHNPTYDIIIIIVIVYLGKLLSKVLADIDSSI